MFSNYSLFLLLNWRSIHTFLQLWLLQQKMPLFLFLRECWSTIFEEHSLTSRQDQNTKYRLCDKGLIYHPWLINLFLSSCIWYQKYHFGLMSPLASRVLSRCHQIHLTLNWAMECLLPGCTSDFLLGLFLCWVEIHFRLMFGTELCCSCDVVVSRQSMYLRDLRQKLPRPGRRQGLKINKEIQINF